MTALPKSRFISLHPTCVASPQHRLEVVDFGTMDRKVGGHRVAATAASAALAASAASALNATCLCWVRYGILGRKTLPPLSLCVGSRCYDCNCTHALSTHISRMFLACTILTAVSHSVGTVEGWLLQCM